jgi:tripartite-type tricarboxylate transporter receptor subunit TctC
MHRFFLWAWLVLAPWAFTSPALAEWPSKPITLIAPFPPGGVSDTVARPLAQALARELGQAVVVENKVGAGGALGIGLAARAPADGYTLLMGLPSMSILPEADAQHERKPGFTAAQFKPIARITADPTILVVRADAPWQTLADLVADARKHPRAYNYGSSGHYSTMHVPMEMLKHAANFDITHIPYSGAGPAVLALLAGQIDAVATGPSTVMQHIQAGKLRALAHWGDKPLAALPGLPSLKQSGYAVSFVQWSALFVPAGVAPEIVQLLREATRKAAADPQLMQTISRAGSPVEYLDAAEFQRYWDADSRQLTAQMRRMGKLQ